jgi:pimeloyl-ACP methyl ester carboxylesterase
VINPVDNVQKRLFVFSGLGADERVFQKLDLSGFSVTFIQWETPNLNESIEHYAGRLIRQITIEKPILLGLSFGGLIAIEVAKQIETQKVILISSAKTKQEIPFYYRTIGNFGLHKLIPLTFLLKSNFIANWFFGTSSRFDRQTLKAILKDTPPTFLRWAIDRIVHWANVVVLQNVTHIHGTSDRILPIRFVRCNYQIRGGGHLMALNRSKEIEIILSGILDRE